MLNTEAQEQEST